MENVRFSFAPKEVSGGNDLSCKPACQHRWFPPENVSVEAIVVLDQNSITHIVALIFTSSKYEAYA